MHILMVTKSVPTMPNNYVSIIGQSLRLTMAHKTTKPENCQVHNAVLAIHNIIVKYKLQNTTVSMRYQLTDLIMSIHQF